MIVAVDFDNCLVEYADTPFGEFTLKPCAKEVISKYANLGVEFVLNSARYGSYLEPALEFIEKEALPIKHISSMEKINADIYIDDKNIFCKEVDWKEIDKELERLLR